MTSIEIWKKVNDYEGIYSISSFGRLRRENHYSIDRMLQRKILSNTKRQNHYQTNILCNGISKKSVRRHTLVMRAFVGERKSLEVNHINGIKNDNRLCNLEYVTRSENFKHAYRIGLKKPIVGENRTNNKLSEKDVLKIREIYDGTISMAKIAVKFGVCQNTIFDILHRKKWKHI